MCTAAGLCVAIPAYFFHRYFRGLVSDYVVDMEQQVILLMDELTAYAEPASASVAQRVVRARAGDPPPSPRTERTRATDSKV